MATKRAPGRPRSDASAKTAAADRVIGRTVFQLLSWGYTMRSRGVTPGVCEVVGIAALAMLKRADSRGRALGPDRVEQIFDEWLLHSVGGWVTTGGVRLPLQKNWTATAKRSLIERRPDGDLEAHAGALIGNAGRWPGYQRRHLEDPEPTAKFAVSSAPRLKRDDG